MILANYAQQNRNTIREFGIGFTNPLAQFKPAHFASLTTSADASCSLSLSAFNNGYNTHYAWWPAMKPGGLASTLNIEGDGGITANALAVKLAEADLTGSGDLAAVGSLIVQLIADLTGSGSISSADLKAFLQAVAALTGSGTAAGTASGLGALIAALTGAGTVSPTLTGTGELDADLVVTGTGLTTANVGQAVWAAIASANNATGTMGEKLNDAGSASNPWTEVIESGYTAAEIMRLIAAAVAGKASGADSNTPTFRDLGDTKDRISAVTDDNGNRTSITYDAS